MFDPECYKLAEYFLDGPDATKTDKNDLAQTIQHAIEDWLGTYEQFKAEIWEHHHREPHPGDTP